MTKTARDLLEALFITAVDAALPARCLPPHLPPPPAGRTVVIGAGKGAGAMARAVEENWPGPFEGLVVTRRGHGVPCETIEVIEAAHPVPDGAGEAAARRILDAVANLTADDLVLFLVSGGGSALLSLPAPGLSLDDKRAVTAALLRSGAAIGEINCGRKHLSAIKGGRLAAAAHPAQFVSLLISDVPGDDPAVIASGPGIADPGSFAEARAVLEKYAIEPPAARAPPSRRPPPTRRPSPAIPASPTRAPFSARRRRNLTNAQPRSRAARISSPSCWAMHSKARHASSPKAMPRWRARRLRRGTCPPC